MPLYEYRCNGCSETFELLRPMADRPVEAICPSCESATPMPLIEPSSQPPCGSERVPSARPRVWYLPSK